MAKNIQPTNAADGKEVVKVLSDQAEYMRTFWALNRALFNRDNAALQEMPEEFFGRLDDATFQVVNLAVSRMTDPPGTGSRRNASIAQAVQLLGLSASHPQLLLKAMDARGTFEGYRNKYYAHTCFHVHVERTQTPPAHITRGDIGRAVSECSWVVATLCEIAGVKPKPERDSPDDWIAAMTTLALNARDFQQMHDRASSGLAISAKEIVEMRKRHSRAKIT